MRELLLSLFTKRAKGANPSGHYLQKEQLEQNERQSDLLFMIEQFTLYDSAISSFQEWALLLFIEKTVNWTYKFISHFLALLL